jgi:hypothetical protein
LLSQLDLASALAIGLLIFALVMVMAFEATNGLHDAANAVATVIYTKSLTPVQAVVWSGFMNFLGVLLGGIAVAYALVELLPAEVLSLPSGGPAVGMLVALFISGAILEHRDMVAWLTQFQLALPDWSAYWRCDRQCSDPRSQPRRERALVAGLVSSRSPRLLTNPRRDFFCVALFCAAQDRTRRQSL